MKKNLSSPSPTKPSGLSRSVSSSSITDLQQRFCSPKRFREGNENEQEKASSLNSSRSVQKAMKTPPTKHFMSPTISAASKAVAPRKKVLSERNDGAEDLDFDGHSVRSSQNSTTPLSSRGFERVVDDDDDDDDDVLEPSFQPYDPLTNYLSPRPKFLRYNPNRRMEILHRRDGDLRKRGEDPNVSVESQKLIDEGLIQSLSSSSLEDNNSLKQEGESSPNAEKSSPEPCRDDGIKEKLEKAEEERSMSKASDDSSLLGDGYSSSDARASDSSSSTLEGLEPQLLPDVEESAEWEDDDDEEDEEEERHWNVARALKALLFLLLTVLSISIAAPSQSLVDFKQAYHKLQHHVSAAAVNDVTVSGVFFDVKQENEQNFIDADLEDVSQQIGEGLETRQEVAAEVANFYQVSDIEHQADELSLEHYQSSDEVQFEKPDGDAIQVEKSEVVVWDPNQVPTGNVAVHEAAKEEKVELESSIEDLRDETAAVESCNIFQAPMEELTNEEVVRKEEKVGDESDNMADATNGIVEVVKSRGGGGGEIGDDYGSYESLKPDPFNEFMFNELDDQITGFSNSSSAVELQHKDSLTTAPSVFTLAAIGASLLSVFVAFAALRFLHQKCKRTFSKGSRPTTKKSLRAKSVEFRSAPLPLPLPLPKRAIEVDKVEHYKGNGYQKYYENQMPAVELLGEYVVSPFRRHEIESKPVESEASSLSCSDEKWPGRKAVSSANHEYSSISDYSAAQSPSYGSFTTQEKILIKEGGVFNTPVRRSSRIANRAVMSP